MKHGQAYTVDKREALILKKKAKNVINRLSTMKLL